MRHSGSIVCLVALVLAAVPAAAGEHPDRPAVDGPVTEDQYGNDLSAELARIERSLAHYPAAEDDPQNWAGFQFRLLRVLAKGGQATRCLEELAAYRAVATAHPKVVPCRLDQVCGMCIGGLSNYAGSYDAIVAMYEMVREEIPDMKASRVRGWGHIFRDMYYRCDPDTEAEARLFALDRAVYYFELARAKGCRFNPKLTGRMVEELRAAYRDLGYEPPHITIPERPLNDDLTKEEAERIAKCRSGIAELRAKIKTLPAGENRSRLSRTLIGIQQMLCEALADYGQADDCVAELRHLFSLTERRGIRRDAAQRCASVLGRKYDGRAAALAILRLSRDDIKAASAHEVWDWAGTFDTIHTRRGGEGILLETLWLYDLAVEKGKKLSPDERQHIKKLEELWGGTD